MACDERIRELISCYEDGEATPEEAARARAHLAECPDCRRTAEEWSQGLEMFEWAYTSAMPEAPPDRIDIPMNAPEPERRQYRRRLPLIRAWLPAAAVILIAATGIFAYQHFQPSPLDGSITTQTQARVVSMEGVRLKVAPQSQIAKTAPDAVELERGKVTASVGRQAIGFQVRTQRLVVTDLGTKFTVEVQPTSDIVQVHKGSVSVQSDGESRVLSRGDSIVAADSAEPVLFSQGGGGGIPMISGIITLLAILGIGFWIWMFIDVLRRDFPDGGSKIAWVLVILIGGTLGAIIYFAVVKAKDARWNRPVGLPLVGRRGDKRVIVWGNVAVLAVVGGIIAALATVAYHAITGVWSAWIWLLFTAILQLAIAVAVRQGMAQPADQLPILEISEARYTENGGSRILCRIVLVTAAGLLALVLISVIRSFVVGSAITWMPVVVFTVAMALIIAFCAFLLARRDIAGLPWIRGIVWVLPLILIGMIVFIVMFFAVRSPGGREKDRNAGQIIAYAAAGNNESVARLLSKDSSLVSVKLDSLGQQTPLHQAAIYGQAHTAELLISRGADLNAQDEMGDTPLHLAVRGEHSGLVRALLNARADINARNRTGVTPLMTAIPRRNREIAQVLLGAGADPDAQDEEGVTALHLSAKVGDDEIAEMLIAGGADLNLRDTREGLTPLAWAVDWGSKDVAGLLLKQGADGNLRDANGETALHRAVRTGHPEMAELLR